MFLHLSGVVGVSVFFYELVYCKLGKHSHIHAPIYIYTHDDIAFCFCFRPHAATKLSVGCTYMCTHIYTHVYTHLDNVVRGTYAHIFNH